MAVKDWWLRRIAFGMGALFVLFVALHFLVLYSSITWRDIFKWAFASASIVGTLWGIGHKYVTKIAAELKDEREKKRRDEEELANKVREAGEHAEQSRQKLIKTVEAQGELQEKMLITLNQLAVDARQFANDLADVRDMNQYNGKRSNREVVWQMDVATRIQQRLLGQASDRAIIVWQLGTGKDPAMECAFVTDYFTELTGVFASQINPVNWVDMLAPGYARAIAEDRRISRETGQKFDTNVVAIRPDKIHHLKMRIIGEPVFNEVRVDNKAKPVAWIVEFLPQWPEFIPTVNVQ